MVLTTSYCSPLTAHFSSGPLTLLSSVSPRPQCSSTAPYPAPLSFALTSPDEVSACGLSLSSRQTPSRVRDIRPCTPSDRTRLSTDRPTVWPSPILSCRTRDRTA